MRGDYTARLTGDATALLHFPRIRYVLDPERPALQGDPQGRLTPRCMRRPRAAAGLGLLGGQLRGAIADNHCKRLIRRWLTPSSGGSASLSSDDDLRDSIETSRETFRRTAEQASPWPETRQPRPTAEEQVASSLHPFFRGLLETLPEPGSEWSGKEREQWLETARNVFALIYKESGDEREQARGAPPVRLDERPPQTARPEAQHEARPETHLDQRSG